MSLLDINIDTDMQYYGETFTEVHEHNGVRLWVKRGDLFGFGGQCGAKMRACYGFLQEQKKRGIKNVFTAGAPKSPQIAIVSECCKLLDMVCTVFTWQNSKSDIMAEARANGATVVVCHTWHNNVIESYARAEALKVKNSVCVPFGMDFNHSIAYAAKDAETLPKDIKVIIMPVGSGMNLCGVLRGLDAVGHSAKVIGVMVGASPQKRLQKYCNAEQLKRLELVQSKHNYSTELQGVRIGGVLPLDPVYEAKCVEHIPQEEDCLFWIVGRRKNLL